MVLNDQVSRWSWIEQEVSISSILQPLQVSSNSWKVTQFPWFNKNAVVLLEGADLMKKVIVVIKL